MKATTAKQNEILSRIEAYNSIKISSEAFYVKNKVIGLWIDSISKIDIAKIERFGNQFGVFSVVPGGHNKINLILQGAGRMTDNHYYEKRRNTPRLPIVYTTPEILQKLDYLAGIHGSKKAAIEMAISALYCSEQQK